MKSKLLNMILSKATIIEFIIIYCLFKYLFFSIIILIPIIMFLIYRNYTRKKSSILIKENREYLMKGIEFCMYDKEKFIMNDIHIPCYSNDEVLIKVKAASINPVDTKIIFAYIPFLRLYFSHISGFDISGIIIDKGSNVNNFQIGDEIYGHTLNGAIAEYTVSHNSYIALKSKKQSFIEAAAMPVAGATSYKALSLYSLKDKNVLIIGASGGCGSIGVQISKALGAYNITGVCSTSKVNFVKSLGTDNIIDYNDPNSLNLLESEKKTFDIIYDTVTSYWDPNQEVIYGKFLSKNGKLLQIGGSIPDILRYFISCCINFQRNNYNFVIYVWSQYILNSLTKLVDEEKIKINVEDVHEFNEVDVNNAFKKLKEKKAKGKIVIKI